MNKPKKTDTVNKWEADCARFNEMVDMAVTAWKASPSNNNTGHLMTLLQTVKEQYSPIRTNALISANVPRSRG